MACDTCVEITLNAEAMGEENIRLKRSNTILRTTNSVLRRRIQTLLEDADEVFLAICDTDKAAELAIGELWGSGLFDCGPQDYEIIVARCLAAVASHDKATGTCASSTGIEHGILEGGLPFRTA